MNHKLSKDGVLASLMGNLFMNSLRALFQRFILLQFNPFRVKLAAFMDFAFSAASIGRIISEGAGFNVNA
jgi:hypothetical protein